MENTTTTIVENAQQYADDVKQYSDLIQTYGASTVIIAVFIIVLLVILGYILRSNQKTNNQLIKQQQNLVDALLENKKKNDEEETTNNNEQAQHPTITKEPDIIQSFLSINSSIKEILKYIYDDTECSRVSVYVFHNGVYSSHGLPFFKTSCVCEIIRKNCGVAKRINLHHGLPLQLFDNSISYIYKNGNMTVVDVDDEEDEVVHDTPMLMGMFKNNNIKSATGIAVYDNDNNIIGVVIVEFVELKSKDFLDSVEKILINKAPLLSPILEYSGIYDATNT